MILRIIIAAVIVYVFYRIARILFLPAGRKIRPLTREKEQTNQGEDLIEDPCCHAYVPISQAHKLDVNGEVVFFCSRTCLEQYEKQRKEKREDL
jgi:YHS domain-containing protein